jgi:hypothetical protein
MYGCITEEPAGENGRLFFFVPSPPAPLPESEGSIETIIILAQQLGEADSRESDRFGFVPPRGTAI